MDDTFYFVDLPGYGYSKMSKKEQEQVGKFIEQYLFHRNEIMLIIFLIDIRHSPTSNDKLMYNYIISSGLPCLILANKADKIALTKVDAVVKNLQKELNPIGDIPTMPFSSERKIYKDDVWNFIDDFLTKKSLEKGFSFRFSNLVITFKAFSLGSIITCPHPWHFNLKSTPILVISHNLLPQGCTFFVLTISPIL